MSAVSASRAVPVPGAPDVPAFDAVWMRLDPDDPDDLAILIRAGLVRECRFDLTRIPNPTNRSTTMVTPRPAP
jgi:hypothetical protein